MCHVLSCSTAGIDGTDPTLKRSTVARELGDGILIQDRAKLRLGHHWPAEEERDRANHQVGDPFVGKGSVRELLFGQDLARTVGGVNVNSLEVGGETQGRRC